MKKIRTGCFTIVIFLLFGQINSISAQITLPSIFNDNMVLQQNFDAPIWGWAEPGTEVFVSGSWSRMTARTAIADEDGRQCRLVDTEDLKIQAEEVTGVELDPFWDVFFREASYPFLDVVRGFDETTFSWQTENSVLLDVDIPIRVNGIDQIVEMIDGYGTVAILPDDVLVIDPNDWILMADPQIIVGLDDIGLETSSIQLKQNYPNPFSTSTTIRFSIPESQFVSLKVFDVYGNEVASLVNTEKSSGNHKVIFDGSNLAGGTYFYRLQADDFVQTKRLVLIRK